MDQMIGSKQFVAGAQPTIADCTLFAALEFASFAQAEIDYAKLKNLGRWYEGFKQRPSASA
jgi:glutathione S-transferase